ncbi:hypothetical protein TWF481_008024 [Arthrobotrys musiformis]|uniref:Myb-like DNA-binding domain-containing protein n=1 Tax=Arthrobotrys musiformis TaxID=47236 RepID=A0AAV9W618_9PEZI
MRGFKPDFNLVAQERGIVNGSAAGKRFRRMLAAHGIGGSTPSKQASPKKGPKSPPTTDEDEENVEEPEEEVKVEETANTSKKRKRRSQQPQTPRKRRGGGRKVKVESPLKENKGNMMLDEEGEEE